MGDYITIVSDNTGGNVAYTATFNGEEDIYYVRVAPGGAGSLSLRTDRVFQSAAISVTGVRG